MTETFVEEGGPCVGSVSASTPVVDHNRAWPGTAIGVYWFVRILHLNPGAALDVLGITYALAPWYVSPFIRRTGTARRFWGGYRDRIYDITFESARYRSTVSLLD